MVFCFCLIADIHFSALHFYGVSIFRLKNNDPLIWRWFLTATHVMRPVSSNSWKPFQTKWVRADCRCLRSGVFSSALCNLTKNKSWHSSGIWWIPQKEITDFFERFPLHSHDSICVHASMHVSSKRKGYNILSEKKKIKNNKTHLRLDWICSQRYTWLS